MRVLVTGGRSYDEPTYVFRTLDWLRKELVGGVSLVMQGGASGADRCARAWATTRGIPCVTYHANWKYHGEAAGPIRNEDMLGFGEPNIVVAFPGGRGTENMVDLARDAGIEVMVIEKEQP